jgi:hypothetical protein
MPASDELRAVGVDAESWVRCCTNRPDIKPGPTRECEFRVE